MAVHFLMNSNKDRLSALATTGHTRASCSCNVCQCVFQAQMVSNPNLEPPRSQNCALDSYATEAVSKE